MLGRMLGRMLGGCSEGFVSWSNQVLLSRFPVAFLRVIVVDVVIVVVMLLLLLRLLYLN